MKPILFIIACLSIFTTLTAQDTTNATPKFYHHEILFTPVGTHFGTFLLSGINYAAGYRYHYSLRSAFRITQSISLTQWATSFRQTASDYNSFVSTQLGYQYALSKKPFHGLIFTDLLLISLQHSDKNAGYSTTKNGGYIFLDKDRKTLGFGAGGGIGAEYLIKNRIALLLTGELSGYYGNTTGVRLVDEVGNFIDTSYQANSFNTIGNIKLSVSYRFR